MRAIERRLRRAERQQVLREPTNSRVFITIWDDEEDPAGDDSIVAFDHVLRRPGESLGDLQARAITEDPQRIIFVAEYSQPKPSNVIAFPSAPMRGTEADSETTEITP